MSLHSSSCFYQDLRPLWISASEPPFAFVRETGGQFRVNLCVTKPKEAPSKWARGSESWEKEFELCFTSGARSSVFVWEVPPACAAWHISGGGAGRARDEETRLWWTASLCWSHSCFCTSRRVYQLNRQTTDGFVSSAHLLCIAMQFHILVNSL